MGWLVMNKELLENGWNFEGKIEVTCHLCREPILEGDGYYIIDAQHTCSHRVCEWESWEDHAKLGIK